MQNNTNLSEYISQADGRQLLTLIRNADISIGHLPGRFMRVISVPNYNGSVPFGEFQDRCIKVYRDAVLSKIAADYPGISELEISKLGEVIRYPSIDWNDEMTLEIHKIIKSWF